MKNSYHSPWIVLSILWVTTAFAQDAYHQELIAFLASDHDIHNPTYVFFGTEQQIVNGMYIYGNSTLQTNAITDNTFSIRQDYNVNAVGSNAWDSGAGMRSITSVSKEDVIVVSFWARKTSDESEVTFFAEDGTTFDKELDFKISFTSDWTRYFGAFKSRKEYAANGLTVGFHLASQVQTFELGGFTALNFGDIDLTKAPSTYSPQFYGGYESDAAWRIDAGANIENMRKKDLIIKVADAAGNSIEGADIKVEMQKHAFGFGSALVGCRFPGNRCEDQTYLEKIENLDGAGHGFNVAVTENALKWDGWEEEWIGTPEETVAAVQWIVDRGIEVRGHTLIWPGWDHMPNDIQDNKGDLNLLRNRINGRLEEMLLHPKLANLIVEWDVLNEITQVRDLEAAFMSDPNLVSGREIYQDVLKKAKELQPNLRTYINDYIVLSGGGAGSSVVNRYKSYLEEIVVSGAEFDGIGFQCHIGSQPTSIPKIKEVFDEFSDTYGKRIKITEYDVNPSVDPATQGKYMADFLTMIFSHPAIDAFLMWGFWDGNHWKGNAPMFNLDWTLKPSGQAFIDKVFRDWWTNEQGITSVDGTYALRPFKGTHKVSASVNGNDQVATISTADTDTLTFVFASTSAFDLTTNSIYQVFPNPASDYIQINSDEIIGIIDVQILSAQGKLLQQYEHQSVGQGISLHLPAGFYYAKITSEIGTQVSKFMIQN